jgi:hypothetical protein
MQRTNPMSRKNLTIGFGLCLCAFAVALALPIQSQGQVPVADTSKPLIVKKGKDKPGKFYGEVVSSTPKSIQVRSQQNKTVIRMFSYGPNAAAEIARVNAKGGYRFGDKVVIDYTPGSDIALRIKGKPSS